MGAFRRAQRQTENHQTRPHGFEGVALEMASLLSSLELQDLLPEMLAVSILRPKHAKARLLILSLRRKWLLRNIEAAAEPLLESGDDWEYRRLLELYALLEPSLVLRLAGRAAGDTRAEVREAGEDFLYAGWAVAMLIPERARRRALATGETGAVWLESLDNLVRDLAEEWHLSIGQAIAGGTESFVTNARSADGQDFVLKIAIPGLDPAGGELRTLLAAQGQGYAGVFRHDAARGAMLLERLGPRLLDLELSVDAQIEAVCHTLNAAWKPLPKGPPFMTGAEKALTLSDFIETAWADLGRPCPTQTIELACQFAEIRCRAFDPETAVLAHGDPHACNTLAVLGTDPRRYKFVDPDGLFIERAYDLGILMREWSRELLAGDPYALGRRRCGRLAELTGVDPQPIWQWGFIERTANGLLLLKLGLEQLGLESLTVASAWAVGGPL
jgi:streptomycin 6-kinase